MRYLWLIVLGLFIGTEARAIPPEASARDPRGRSRRYISAHAYYHAMRADLARSAGDLETARHSLRLALVYDPASVDLHLELARVLIDLDEGQPERLVQRAIQLDPKRAEGWSAKGDLLVRRGQKRAAERAYQRAFRLEPASPEGRHAASALASLHQLNGRPELARRVLKRLAEVDAEEGGLLLATHDLSQGRSREAEAALSELATAASPELKRRVAERFAWLFRYDIAEPLYASSLQSEDQRLRVTDKELRANLHLALLVGDEVASRRALARIFARAGMDEQLRAAESVLAAGRGAVLRELSLRREKGTEVEIGLLALEVAAGASDASLRARVSDSSSPVPRVRLVEALLRRGDHHTARLELAPMAPLEPKALAAALGPAGYERFVGLMLRLHSDVAPRFLAAVNPPIRARIVSARVALEQGHPRDAQELLSDEAVESDAEALAILSRLDLSGARRRRVELRVDHALERDPESATLWRARARLYAARDEFRQARVALGRSLFHQPDLQSDEGLLRALRAELRAEPAAGRDRFGARP